MLVYFSIWTLESVCCDLGCKGVEVGNPAIVYWEENWSSTQSASFFTFLGGPQEFLGILKTLRLDYHWGLSKEEDLKKSCLLRFGNNLSFPLTRLCPLSNTCPVSSSRCLWKWVWDTNLPLIEYLLCVWHYTKLWTPKVTTVYTLKSVTFFLLQDQGWIRHSLMYRAP